MSDYELLPQSVIDRIEYVEDEKGGEVREFIKAKRAEMGREPGHRDILDDQRYLLAKRRDEENEWELKRLERRWAQLQTLGEWTLEQVATFPGRYDRWPSARDAALGCPSQVTREEVAMVLDHLVELGFLEGFESKGTRGPATVRYRLTHDGATLMADHLGDVDAESDEPEEPEGATGDTGEAVHEGAEGAAERRVGADGAPA